MAAGFPGVSDSRKSKTQPPCPSWPSLGGHTPSFLQSPLLHKSALFGVGGTLWGHEHHRWDCRRSSWRFSTTPPFHRPHLDIPHCHCRFRRPVISQQTFILQPSHSVTTLIVLLPKDFQTEYHSTFILPISLPYSLRLTKDMGHFGALVYRLLLEGADSVCSGNSQSKGDQGLLDGRGVKTSVQTCSSFSIFFLPWCPQKLWTSFDSQGVDLLTPYPEHFILSFILGTLYQQTGTMDSK